jgi:hypothetical protein
MRSRDGIVVRYNIVIESSFIFTISVYFNTDSRTDINNFQIAAKELVSDIIKASRQ